MGVPEKDLFGGKGSTALIKRGLRPCSWWFDVDVGGFVTTSTGTGRGGGGGEEREGEREKEI